MAKGTAVVARVGLDDSGFQEGVSKIQRSLKVMQSEFAAASSKLGDFGKSTDGLKLKADNLSRQMELQKDKVATLSKAYQESVEKKGEDAKATENLRIKLNYANAELSNMQMELDATTKELRTKTSAWYKLSESMEAAGAKMKAVGAKMASAGKTLSTAVTLPLLGIGTAATKMAMDAIESENLFEVAMGSLADDARKWSVETSKALGLNEYNVRKNVATYNAMLTSMGLTSNESLNMSESLTQLSYDMASFYNLNPEEAFNKLKSGISGEAEPLKALGILVNDNTIKTYAYTHGIAKQGAQLTETQKVQARYGVILEATKNAQGDLARTMDSPTNKIRAMKEQVQAIAIQFGQLLIPLLEKLIATIKPFLDHLQSLSKEQQELIVKVALVAAAVGPVLIIVGKVVAAVGTLTTAFGGVSLAIAEAGGASAVLSSAIAALTGPIAITIAAVAGFIAVFTLLYRSNEDFRNTVSEVWTQVRILVGEVVESLKALFQSFVQFASGIWAAFGSDIVSVLSAAFNVAAAVVKTTLEAIKNILQIVTGIMKGNWKSVWEGIKNLTQTLWNGIKETIGGALGLIKSLITLESNVVKSIVSTVWATLQTVTSNIWKGIRDAIEIPMVAAKNTVKGVIDAIWGFFANLRIPEIKIPKIKLPHFELSGKFSLAPPEVPSFGIKWYREGGLLTSPTLFGFDGKNLLGGGESGTGGEAILPLNRLVPIMASAMKSLKMEKKPDDKEMLYLLRKIAEKDMDVYLDGRKLSNGLYDYIDDLMTRKLTGERLAKGGVY